jgi:hypothetical protein
MKKRKFPDSVDDIFSFVAQDTGFSRDTVRFVIKNFESSLKMFLRNPLKAGRQILLTGFCKITFDTNDALERYDILKRYYPQSKDAEYYDQLLKTLTTSNNGERTSTEDSTETKGFEGSTNDGA